MRYQRHTFLAGIAALALIAGTGLASAQEPGKDQNGAQGKEPRATQQMNKAPAAGKMGQTGKTGQSAQEENRAKGKMGQSAQQENRQAGTNGQKLNRQAQEHYRGDNSAHMAQTERRKEGAMARHEGAKGRTMAEERSRKAGNATAARERNRMQNTAEREHNGLEGLQGNASGTNVQLSEQQRTQIRETVINAHGAPRIDNVNFNVAVGTVIPHGSIHVVPVPETLVRIEPAWRGFLYFVWNDEVVIVNPRDMRIVAVVYA